MHISSIPSEYGIGTFGKKAYEFVDFLKAAGQKYWQILPLCPVDDAGSPYQSYSTFAGNYCFIDFDMLREDGLLQKGDYATLYCGKDEEVLEFEKISENRLKVLKIAYKNAVKTNNGVIVGFIEKNVWVKDYALFMTLLEKNGYEAFWNWDEQYKNKEKEVLDVFYEENKDEVNFWAFVQQKFYEQWFKLKKYANENGVDVIGDLPIYVAGNSADVWTNSLNFCLDSNKKPKKIAGCPPDMFAKDGQLWGNPIYDWEHMKKDDYSWWQNRLKLYCKTYDVVRIDHFRGFDEYYAIAAGEKTAVNGHWEKGPGLHFFEIMEKKLGKLNLIAEDLGFITDSVRKLLKDTNFPGMKVLQHAFDDREIGCGEALLHNCRENYVYYVGTHDNNTALGWYNDISEKSRDYCNKYLHIKKDDNVSWELIRAAMMSVCKVCIIQMQDFLELDGKARMNTPGTVDINWRWRMRRDVNLENLAEKIYDITRLYGRI